MSAEILRKAASLMRERAEATFVINSATREPIPWHTEAGLANEWDREDAGHIAGMSPAVALAVADWLDHEADANEQHRASATTADLRLAPALAVATTYLGESA